MRISDWSSDVCSSDLIQRQQYRYGDRHHGDGDQQRPLGLVIAGQRIIHRQQPFGILLVDLDDGLVQGLAVGAIGVVVALLVGGLRALFDAELRRLAAELREIVDQRDELRSEEHTSELQSLMRISYAVFCLKKKTH